MLEIKNLKKTYGNISPLKDVNAKIEKGEIISIIGPSGTGKSTLLRCINKLEYATDGKVYFEGQDLMDEKCDICKVRRKMGMVFQTFNLFENLTILENIMSAPVSLLKMPKEKAKEMAMDLLKKVGLLDKANSYPYELSGGQKQRVAILRSIAMKPDIILFDEPTSALDPTMIDEILEMIKHLASQGYTMLIVTHEMEFAKSISTRVFYMDEGIIYEEGTPDNIFNHPKKEKTKAFIYKLKSFVYVIKKGELNFYDILKEFLDYISKKHTNIRGFSVLNLLLEEIIVNEILANVKAYDNIELSINIENEKEVKMTFSGFIDFDYTFSKTNELTKKIVEDKLISKDVNENERKIVYILNFNR